jgi:Subtilase family
MCYVVSEEILLGFPTGDELIEQIGYELLEEYSAELLSQVVRACRPGLKEKVPTEVGRIRVPAGSEQATIALLNKRIVYSALRLLDRTPDPATRGRLLAAFDPGSTGPVFQVEPNAPFAAAGAPGGQIDFVLDSAHRAGAEAMLGLPGPSRGAGMRIGIIDTGLDPQYAPTNVTERINVMRWDDPARRADVADRDGHGSQMADIIATQVPDAEFSIVKIFDDFGCATSWHLMAGMATVPDCHVLNVSMESSPRAQAFPCGHLCDEMVSGLLAAVVRDASKRDAVVVAAAGNSASAPLAYPARVGATLAVVSVNSSRSLSSFSNWGLSADDGSGHGGVFASPGGDSAAQGAPQTERVGSDSSGVHDYFGTSHAAAYASAVVALHREANPTLNAAAVIADLASYADKKFPNYSSAPAKYGNGVIRLP